MRQDDARARARLAESEAALGQAQARLDELMYVDHAVNRFLRRVRMSKARKMSCSFAVPILRACRKSSTNSWLHPSYLTAPKRRLDAAQANDKLRRAQLQELLTGTTIEELAQAENAVKQADCPARLARCRPCTP